MIGMACKKLVTTVSEYSETVTNEKTRRQLDLERRSINSELKQVVTQMALVKKFNDTKASQEYKMSLLSASLSLVHSITYILDTVDKSRCQIENNT